MDAKPEYAGTSIGEPDWRNIANRLEDLASVCHAYGKDHVADYAEMAAGHLMAELAAESTDASPDHAQDDRS